MSRDARFSGTCVSCDAWIDDVHIADHTLVLSVDGGALSAAGGALAMMKNIVCSKMACRKSAGVAATVVTGRLGRV